MALPRILTFNFHEPYLCLMAKSGLPMDVGVYESGDLARTWHTAYRPIPGNLRLVAEQDWRTRVETGHYDVIIAQNEMNALHLYRSPSPKLIVFHNRRNFMETTATTHSGDAVEGYAKLLQLIAATFTPVYISETKKASYGMPGHVIPPGIDLDEFHGYTGEMRCLIRVGNTMRPRNLMFDVPFQEAACEGLPNRVIGANPDIAGSAIAQSFQEYRELLRRNRCMLHVTREAYEDGYNLALLEAMATGMPAVALSNATCPLMDGVNGYVSDDVATLRERLSSLLEDAELARRLGVKARETVGDCFPMRRFAERWREAITASVEQHANFAGGQLQPSSREEPARILLHYLSSPLTTGRYVEEALRERHRVVTAGFRVPEEVLRLWGFTATPPAYPALDVDLPHAAPYAQMRAGLPRDFTPDFYLYIDSGPERIEPDIDCLEVPRAAWLIDTHISPELRLAMAHHFDWVFLAQNGQVESFRAAGIANIEWLPLACSPGLHAVPAPGRHYDVAYVGSFSAEEGDRRGAILRRIAAAFPNSFIGRAWPGEMAEIYAQAKIVVNAAYNRDVNMRVFEAMASGALLITDDAEGLEDLFVDGEHLVVYRDPEELPGLVRRFLDDEEARERIAAAGQREVLDRHTYAHRMSTLVERVREKANIVSKPVVEHEVKHDTYYRHVRRELFPFVPRRTRRLLDIGCGAGQVASTLKRERGLEFAAGVEIVEEAYHVARQVLDAAVLANIEETDLDFPPASFDCIICADVLEHLKEPEQALRKLAALLHEDGVIVMSLPNARYRDVIDMLSHGYWSYMPEGIMDSTHLRWFTRRNIPAFVREAGMEVLHYQPLSLLDADRFPLGTQGEARMGKLTLRDVTPEEYEELRTYQHCVVAGHPGRDRLATARAAMEQGQFESAYVLAEDAFGAPDRDRQFIMARALAKLGRLDAAEERYRSVFDLDHDHEAAAEYGILRLAMNDPATARHYLERAIPHLPGHNRARGALGLVCLQAGDHELAYALLKEAAESSFDHEGLIAALVAAADGAGLLEEALPVVERYVDFYPANPALGCVLASTLIALERGAEARERLDTILIFHPGHAEATALRESLDRHGTDAP